MKWKIYTKRIPVDGGVATRWFWRKPVLESRRESPHGFVTRAECEDDATRHGYSGDSGAIEQLSGTFDGECAEAAAQDATTGTP